MFLIREKQHVLNCSTYKQWRKQKIFFEFKYVFSKLSCFVCDWFDKWACSFILFFMTKKMKTIFVLESKRWLMIIWFFDEIFFVFVILWFFILFLISTRFDNIWWKKTNVQEQLFSFALNVDLSDINNFTYAKSLKLTKIINKEKINKAIAKLKTDKAFKTD